MLMLQINVAHRNEWFVTVNPSGGGEHKLRQCVCVGVCAFQGGKVWLI